MPIKHVVTLECLTDWNHLKGIGMGPPNSGMSPNSVHMNNCEKFVVQSNTAFQFSFVRYFKDEEQFTLWKSDRKEDLQKINVRRQANNILQSTTTETVDTIPE